MLEVRVDIKQFRRHIITNICTNDLALYFVYSIETVLLHELIDFLSAKRFSVHKKHKIFYKIKSYYGVHHQMFCSFGGNGLNDIHKNTILRLKI